MSKRSVGALLVINVVLLTALAVVSLTTQPAQAQLGMRGDYAMIAGQVQGNANVSVVYILDLKSQRIAAITFDSRTKKLQTIAGREVQNDLRAKIGR